MCDIRYNGTLILSITESTPSSSLHLVFGDFVDDPCLFLDRPPYDSNTSMLHKHGFLSGYHLYKYNKAYWQSLYGVIPLQFWAADVIDYVLLNSNRLPPSIIKKFFRPPPYWKSLLEFEIPYDGCGYGRPFYEGREEEELSLIKEDNISETEAISTILEYRNKSEEFYYYYNKRHQEWFDEFPEQYFWYCHDDPLVWIMDNKYWPASFQKDLLNHKVSPSYLVKGTYYPGPESDDECYEYIYDRR